jgi:chromosome segregation ATPase
MNHQSLSRPPLPGSTATPGTLGKSSVYATRIPPHFEGNQGNQGNKSQKKKSLDETLNALLSTPNKMDASPKSVKSPSMHQVLQERGLMKIVEKLPYELRESVVSVLQMAFAASEDIQKDLEFAHHETAVLRSELNKKTHEMATLEKTCEIFRNQIHALEENIESLQDNIESRKRFTNKNRSAMTRLATTNRMLIDALDALENSAVANVVGKPLPASKSQLDVPRTGQLSPISNPRTPKGINHKEYEEKVQRLTMSQNDKLRESLLKIAREHYKSLKNAEHLELKVNELKIALKSQEQLNRNLKSELDEIKAITQVDTTLTVEDKPTDTLATFKAKNFSHIDDRFQVSYLFLQLSMIIVCFCVESD